MTVAPSVADPHPRASRAAWFALVVLTGINLLNYLDRNVIAPLSESLRASPLHVTNTQFGFLASAFLVVYTLSAPAFGVLGDRASRPRLIALGVGVWSLASIASGLVNHYVPLLGTRAAVGIGEAAYGSIAPALLADHFPARMRSRVFAVMYMAIPVGSALGYVVGGVMDAHHGWQSAFLVAGAPGLVLALVALRLDDPPRGTQEARPADAASAPVPGPRRAVYLALARMADYRRVVLGYAAYTFALGGIAVWMPAFLIRERHVPSETASVTLGAVLAVTGLLGTFLGGWMADRLRPRRANANIVVSGVTTLIAAPLALVAFVATAPAVYWSALGLGMLFIFMSTGPVNAAIVEAVPAGMRAAAMAASIFAIHLLGDGLSPTLIGAVADHVGFAEAALLVPAAIFVAAVVWLWRSGASAEERVSGRA